MRVCAALEGRRGIGIELNPRYVKLAKERLKKEVDAELLARSEQQVLRGDAARIIPKLKAGSVKLVVTSPPYWNILHKEDHKAKQERISNGLDTRYGNNSADIGNIPEYPLFLETLADIMQLTHRCLTPNGHICLVVGDFRHRARYYMFHADIVHEMESRGFTLKGITILYQRHKRVFPYGYPYSFVPNFHHQYIVILAKNG